jgi:hypothetical protein
MSRFSLLVAHKGMHRLLGYRLAKRAANLATVPGIGTDFVNHRLFLHGTGAGARKSRPLSTFSYHTSSRGVWPTLAAASPGPACPGKHVCVLPSL